MSSLALFILLFLFLFGLCFCLLSSSHILLAVKTDAIIQTKNRQMTNMAIVKIRAQRGMTNSVKKFSFIKKVSFARLNRFLCALSAG